MPVQINDDKQPVAVHVTHNNDRKFYRIAIDIAKEGGQLWDLTPYFKGRVGDNNFGLQVVWYYQGRLMDLTNKRPYIEGNVGEYSFDDQNNLEMASDAATVSFTGDPNDCEAGGKATYYFPEQMFPKSGIFKGFLGLVDETGKTQHLTGVDIWFKVLPGAAQMGKACDYYISELEKAIANAEEDLRQNQKSMQTIVDEFKDKVNTLYDQLNTQGQTTQSMLTTLQADMQALEAKIKSEGLFTKDEAKVFEDSLDKKIDQLQQDTEEQLSLFKEKLERSSYSVLDFGAKADGKTDDTDAIQNTINQVAADWKAGKFKSNLVVMPGGTYKITKTIILPPYVKLISLGLVTLETYLTSGRAIWIKWLGEDDPNITGAGLGNAYQNQDWQRGYIIDGTFGGFSLVPKLNKPAYTGADNYDNYTIGIELGFSSTKDRGNSEKNVARSGLNNVAIGNYNVGLMLSDLDVFIDNFVNMHIENNDIDVYIANADGGGNAGENIYFDRCVICGAQIGINQQYGGWDITFNECSVGNNKVAFVSYPWANNNITFIAGNLEGNTLIYDGSKATGPNWSSSMDIIGSNMFIRPDNASTLTMFKGPLLLNLDNPYIISTLELTKPEYLVDDKVFVSYNRTPRFGRESADPIFISEHDNCLLDGNDMSKIDYRLQNNKGKLVTADNGLSPQLKEAGYTSALSYTREASDTLHWEEFFFNQRIDVYRKSAFFVNLFCVTHLDPANVDLYISFYDKNDKLIGTTQTFYAGIKQENDKVIYGTTRTQAIPVGAKTATIALGTSMVDVGASFQLGYIGMEME